MTSERGEHVPPVLPELSIHLKSGVLEVLVQLKSCKLKIVIDPPSGLMVVCFLEISWTKQQHWEGCSGMGDGILQWREVVQNLRFKTEPFFKLNSC